jgi:tRNA A-37 threonylcarbamoyl transferase component Bud32
MDEVQRTFPVRHLGALLNQGAEARVFECTYLSKPCVVKERFSKKYLEVMD